MCIEHNHLAASQSEFATVIPPHDYFNGLAYGQAANTPQYIIVASAPTPILNHRVGMIKRLVLSLDPINKMCDHRSLVVVRYQRRNHHLGKRIPALQPYLCARRICAGTPSGAVGRRGVRRCLQRNAPRAYSTVKRSGVTVQPQRRFAWGSTPSLFALCVSPAIKYNAHRCHSADLLASRGSGGRKPRSVFLLLGFASFASKTEQQKACSWRPLPSKPPQLEVCQQYQML